MEKVVFMIVIECNGVHRNTSNLFSTKEKAYQWIKEKREEESKNRYKCMGLTHFYTVKEVEIN